LVDPEGNILIPSIGAIVVTGKTLADVQKEVIEKAKPYYNKSTVTLSLESLRYFRVHVLGEVKFPGTYVAQAVSRVSEMISEAGGATEWAWNREVQLRHPDGKTDTLDMVYFEQEGKLEKNLFVNGGDVIYVPPLSLGKDQIKVGGDFERAGVYQIRSQESLLSFLQRIRAIDQNTDFNKIILERFKVGTKKAQRFIPFLDSKNDPFLLVDGDQILLPSKYVYVHGAVQRPGAIPFVLDLQAKDYAGMAGVTGNINSVKVYHVFNRKTQKGPLVLVEPGDLVDLPQTWSLRLKDYLSIVSTVTSLVIAAKATGLL
jgi:protein involved in polysaccharide export with SLBB domain